MSIRVPQGFRLSGVHCGIKRNPNKEDLTLVVGEGPLTAAGVYTQNLVFAAPVAVDRERTPSAGIRTVVVNSGNANACTGEQGLANALEMTRLAAGACGASPEHALVMSTGIIGQQLPMDKIRAGVAAAAGRLGNDEAAFMSAARGILTTDKSHKVTGRSLSLGGREILIAGMCKGAGMIGPKMATMLGLVLTDVPLTPRDAQAVLSAVADETFNCISVEGHTSTNDTLLLLASGKAGGSPLAGADLDHFREALREMCTELACLIPTDGEGASHLIEIDVRGCADRAGALQIARTIADSPLVKTAVAGGDPNWGRIVSAAGYAGVPLDPNEVNLHINGTLLYRQGQPVEFDAPSASRSIRDQHVTHILLEVGQGEGKCRFWTSDLTVEYVRFNADYHT